MVSIRTSERIGRSRLTCGHWPRCHRPWSAGDLDEQERQVRGGQRSSLRRPATDHPRAEQTKPDKRYWLASMSRVRSGITEHGGTDIGVGWAGNDDKCLPPHWGGLLHVLGTTTRTQIRYFGRRAARAYNGTQWLSFACLKFGDRSNMTCRSPIPKPQALCFTDAV